MHPEVLALRTFSEFPVLLPKVAAATLPTPRCFEQASLLNRYTAVRHARAASNVAGVLCSRPENDQGIIPETEQALITTARRLLDSFSNPPLLLISPMPRCMQTAHAIRRTLESELGIALHAELRAELTERRYGDLEGASYDVWPQLKEHDLIRPSQSFRGAEPLTEFYGRLCSLLDDVEHRHKGRHILLVSHCDPIQVLETLFIGQEVAHYSETRQFANLEFCEFRRGE